MKKGIIFGLILAFFVLLVSGCGGSQTSQENKAEGSKTEVNKAEENKAEENKAAENKEVIKLKVADLFPVTHPVSAEGATVWMKKVEELTGGQVKFDYFPSEQLGKAKDLLKVVQNKVADIAFVGPSYVTAQMPYSSVMVLPGAFNTSLEGEQAYWKMTQGILNQEEFQKNKVTPIMVYTLPPYEVWTTDKSIRLPADVKGLKLRSVGGPMDQTLKLAGAVPVTIPITEMYEAIQKKVVNGTGLGVVSVKPYKVQELLKYTTIGSNIGSYVGLYCVNADVWASLPKNVQEAMLKAGEETSKHLAEVLDKQAEELLTEFEKSGIKVNRLTAEEKQQWSKLAAPVEQDWAEKIGASGGSKDFAMQVLEERKKLISNK